MKTGIGQLGIVELVADIRPLGGLCLDLFTVHHSVHLVHRYAIGWISKHQPAINQYFFAGFDGDGMGGITRLSGGYAIYQVDIAAQKTLRRQLGKPVLSLSLWL